MGALPRSVSHIVDVVAAACAAGEIQARNEIPDFYETWRTSQSHRSQQIIAEFRRALIRQRVEVASEFIEALKERGENHEGS